MFAKISALQLRALYDNIMCNYFEDVYKRHYVGGINVKFNLLKFNFFAKNLNFRKRYP